MSDLYQPSKEQQLQMLKEQTRLTGALHDAQVLQLKMWPLVVFDRAQGSRFTWDPEKKVVVFMLDMPTKGKEQKLAWWEERVKVLNGWVQVLLGEDWYIEVKVTGKKSREYRGSRNLSGAIGNRPVTG
jgi:hypothetical protein